MTTIKSKAQAQWKGNLKEGKGTFSANSGAFSDLPYSFASRFTNEDGTNPEELIAAAHSACFSMALSNELSQAGHTPKSVETEAIVSLKKVEGGFAVDNIALETRGKVPGIDNDTFQKFAEGAKKNCPISQLLTPGLNSVTLKATLL